MTNWCICKLEITGPEADLLKTKSKDFWQGPSAKIDRTDSSVFLSFKTAWDPPVGFIKELSKNLPRSIFNLLYYTESASFAGNMSFIEGAIQRDESYESWDIEIYDFILENFNIDLQPVELH